MDKNILRDELKEAKEWAKINLVGKKVYHEGIGKNVTFTQKGIKHALHTKSSPIKIYLIYHAIKVLKSSTLDCKEKDKKGRADIKNVYRLVNTIEFDNKKYDVFIVIRETKEGFLYYDHGGIKK